MKIVTSIVLAALFLVGCSDSSKETQTLESNQTVVISNPVVDQEESNVSVVVEESNVTTKEVK